METAKLLAVLLPLSLTAWVVTGGSFYRDVKITWGDGRAKVLDGGSGLSLSLDKASGSGFESASEFLFGRFDVQLKLIPGNSAGTVTTYYLSSQGPNHDEVDFEFLGNSSGQPYTVHTNVYAQGRGSREQQFHLWFDPTLAYHTYSILWNPQRIVFTVDGIPLREFVNNEAKGVPFPSKQPMRLYSTLWNADDWATQGGRVKTDWSLAPFTAQYRNISTDGCVSSTAGQSSCPGTFSAGKWFAQEIDAKGKRWLMWVRRNFMIYNYCTDKRRFPQGLPLECRL